MKVKIKYILSAMLITLLIIGCEDHTDDNMMDSKQYFSRTGIIEADIYMTDDYIDYPLYIHQSGFSTENMDAELKVSHAAMERLNEKNGTSYKMLPLTTFKITKAKVEMVEDERKANFMITFDIEALKALANLEEYGVAVEIISEDPSSINQNKKDVLLLPNLREPLIYFNISGVRQEIMQEGESGKLEFSLDICTDFVVQYDVDLDIGFDANTITDYNLAKKTILVSAPDGSAAIEGRVKLLKGSKKSTVKVVVDKSMLTGNIYTVPVVLKSASHYKIDNEKDYLFVRFSHKEQSSIASQMNRGMWINEYTSSWYNDASKMIDGVYTTYWDSFYGTIPDNPAAHQNKNYPFTIIWNLNEQVTMSGVELWRRDHDTYAKDTKAGYIEVSKDNQNWYRAYNFDFGTTDNTRGPLHLPFEDFEGKYVKIVITEGNRTTNVNLTEFFVYTK